MKTLFLLRHAKSSWDNSALADFDRPLNNRGLKAAPLMGETIRQHKFQINSIISSPAQRAGQTALLVKEAARIDCEIEFERGIYEASPQRLREIVSKRDNENQSILLVGHNPGFEGFLKFLTSELQSMPTAALAVIDLRIDEWNKIAADTGNLRTLLRPKELEK